MTVVRDVDAMIAGMAPELAPGRWTFALFDGALPKDAIGAFREAEGWCCIRPASADEEEFALITLRVRSALDGVGLTAAVSKALARAGIACNVVAALHHDHLFVPYRHSGRALGVLKALAEDAMPRGAAE